MTRGGALVLCLFALGCSGLQTNPGGDGGADAGPADAGGADSGAPDAGDDPLPKVGFLSWTQVLPPVGTNEPAYDVHGRSITDAWAAGPNDLMLHYDGSKWAGVSVTGLGRAGSVHVTPSGRVTAAAKNALAICEGNCTSSAVLGFRVQALPSNRRGVAVCGLGDADLYAVGTEALLDHGVLWRFSGGSWVEAISDLGASGAWSCWVSPTGAIYIAATREVVVVQGGGPRTELVDLSSLTSTELSSHVWRRVWGAGGEVFVVGSAHRAARRLSSGAWELMTTPSSASDFLAISGATRHEVYVGGAAAFSNLTLMSWQRTTDLWQAAGEPEALGAVHGLYAAGVDTYLAVGATSAGEPRYWLGTR